MHKRKELIMKYLPFAFLGIVMLIVHSRMGLDTGDDTWFINQTSVDGFNLLRWLTNRYHTWSSRTLIEATMLIILPMKVYVWRILDSFLIVITSLFMSKNFCTDEYIVLKNWLIVLLSFTINFQYMSEAGWGATTLNYVWPLAFAMVAVYSIRKIYDEKPIRKWEYSIYSVSLLFAANMEQLSVVLFITFGVANLVYWIENKKIHKYLIVQFLIAIAELMWIFLCPGNAERQIEEIRNWFPLFGKLGVLKKMELGISNTLNVVLLRENLWILILAMFICLAVWSRYKEWYYRLLGIGLIAVVAVLQFFYRVWGTTRPPYDLMSERGFIRPETMKSEKVWLIYFVLLFICCLILIDIYLVYQESMRTVLVAGMFLMGLMTKAMMGFSPTIWVSFYRTEWVMIYAMLSCSIVLMNDLDYRNVKIKVAILLITIPCGLYGLVNILHI